MSAISVLHQRYEHLSTPKAALNCHVIATSVPLECYPSAPQVAWAPECSKQSTLVLRKRHQSAPKCALKWHSSGTPVLPRLLQCFKCGYSRAILAPGHALRRPQQGQPATTVSGPGPAARYPRPRAPAARTQPRSPAPAATPAATSDSASRARRRPRASEGSPEGVAPRCGRHRGSQGRVRR